MSDDLPRKCPECHLWGVHKLDCITGLNADEQEFDRDFWARRHARRRRSDLVQWDARATKGKAVIVFGLAAPANGHQAMLTARTRVPPGWRLTLTRIPVKDAREHADWAPKGDRW